MAERKAYDNHFPVTDGKATGNESASGVNWQSAGASGTNDRESTDIGSVLVLANETSGTEKQIALNTTKIQELVSGTFTNNGFIIIVDTELNDRFNYRSSDASTAPQPCLQHQLFISSFCRSYMSLFSLDPSRRYSPQYIGQPLMTILRITAAPHFKLLHEANHPSRAPLPGKGSQASDSNLLRSHHLHIHQILSFIQSTLSWSTRGLRCHQNKNKARLNSYLMDVHSKTG
ncbi:MAG TPA: hypothetical protein VFG81_08715 [Anaerolineales bacterium]|nr:hypothetical protein [Anaerolineales bacterium]